MKKLALTAIAAVSVTAAAATYYELAGTFSNPHDIIMMNYADEASCTADQGEWVEDLGCSFAGEDTVEVSKDLNTVSVETVTTNGHTCSVEATVKTIEPDMIIAETPSDEYNDTTGEFETVTCQLTVKYSDANETVAVSSNGKCQSFCGARAIPEIEDAKRTGSF